ncbi:M12 family metallo-peptidase [Frigoriflavimonas asaccharolytica]|uniref:Secretion system C-terminal sorting domain-containing protein n=1 Tax=Frigoriflavimonas asaccharolytica TaxID=2735899 RepID=A0A8J8G599_9FLAO|nr:M12 family metallo-peptidase [Frigoriflavimonas asaccharolytica]NRS90995.1 hypothetical protein [Frigoriflavimonas asaccharolytica]
MKNLTLFALMMAGFFSAQQNLLLNPINENSLSVTEKLSTTMAKSYHSTSYYSENIANINQDFNIKLPNGNTISAVFQKKYQYSNQSNSAVYKIVGDANAELVFSEYNKVITGMYSGSNGDKIIFMQTAPSILAVSLVNEQTLIDQDDPNDTVLAPENIIGNKNILANPDVCGLSPVCGNSTVDVMVLYTGNTKTIYGGVSQSNSFVATAITNFNNSLQNGGAGNVTINLVYTGEISYVESGSINTDLSRLATSGDGFLDDAQTLRATYGADLVSLITASPTNTCGLGYVNTNSSNYNSNSAYTVTISGCVVSNYSLAHEMGHNMGMNHDWYVSTSTNPCSHHKGYTNRTAITGGTSSATSTRWRTIMAYNNECSANGISCTRRNLWSNPGVNYNSEPTGIAIGQPQPSYEIYGFLRVACVVSQFATATVLATKENFVEDFNIYPNPVKDILFVNVPGNKEFNFTIISADGRTIAKTKSKSISVKGYATGVYYLVIYNKENQLIGTKKFVVE